MREGEIEREREGEGERERRGREGRERERREKQRRGVEMEKGEGNQVGAWERRRWEEYGNGKIKRRPLNCEAAGTYNYAQSDNCQSETITFNIKLKTFNLKLNKYNNLG